MSYNLLLPIHAIKAGAMSGTVTSPTIEIGYQDNVCIQLNWTGTPIGLFDVQISSDHLQDSMGNVIKVGQFISLPLLPAIVAAGMPDQAIIDLNQISGRYLKVIYTPTSGTGVLDAYIMAKGI